MAIAVANVIQPGQLVNDFHYYDGMRINDYVRYHIESAVAFYHDLTKSDRVSRIIIEKAIAYNVPINFAMSIAFNESHMNPKAVNYNEETVDRGLFQLNSATFAEWEEDDFFDIRKNVDGGVHYLSDLAKQFANNNILIIYGYNAGVGRIAQGSIYHKTIIHTEHILNDERYLDQQFNYWIQAPGFSSHDKYRELLEKNS